MSVEKMNLLHTIAYAEDADVMLRKLVSRGCLEFVDAYKEFDEAFLDLHIQEGRESELISIHQLTPIKAGRDVLEVKDKLEYVMEKLGMELKPDMAHMTGDYSFEDVKKYADNLYMSLKDVLEEIEDIETRKAKVDQLLCTECLDGVNVDFGMLMQLDNFTVKWGYLTKEFSKKMQRNYENIPALILHIGQQQGNEVYMAVYPNKFTVESEKILRSLDFHELEVPVEYMGFPEEIREKVSHAKAEFASRIQNLQVETARFLEENVESINRSYSRVIMELKLSEIKTKMLSTKNFIYFSAWTPSKNNKNLGSFMEVYGERVYYEFTDVSKNSLYLDIPTSLNNNWLFKPFETLVKMYGVPSYNEIDPTLYFGVVYMLLFGLMFGDFGQGLIFLVAGYAIKKFKHNLNGAILERMGISSMFFGIIYDSFFGYEHVISHALPFIPYLRPIENTNIILGASVAIGIVMLLTSYIFSISNKVKALELEEAYLSRNGVAGLVLFVSLIFLVLGMLSQTIGKFSGILTIMAVASSLALFFKEPIFRKLTSKKPLFKEGAKDYFVESFFEIFETFLSLLSNSVSFIRVGAFALNHVGLSIAFHTLAALANSGVGNVVFFLIGNLVVIFLEGLIVFIQGLRLVFYELFSKYYTGEGREFAPAKLDI